AHQLHGGPIFLTFLRIEREPGQPLEFVGQIFELAEGNLAVVVADGGTGPATATVAEQGDIRSRLEVVDFAVRGEEAKFDEMIAAAAGAKLRPGAIFVLAGNRTDRPIGIEYIV